MPGSDRGSMYIENLYFLQCVKGARRRLEFQRIISVHPIKFIGDI